MSALEQVIEYSKDLDPVCADDAAAELTELREEIKELKAEVEIRCQQQITIANNGKLLADQLRTRCEKLEEVLKASQTDAQALAQTIYNSKRAVLIDNSPCWCTIRSGPHTKHCESLREILHSHNMADDAARAVLEPSSEKE
jgi:hypothetical protein